LLENALRDLHLSTKKIQQRNNEAPKKYFYRCVWSVEVMQSTTSAPVEFDRFFGKNGSKRVAIALSITLDVLCSR
jgi:hypothetical protein